jgi:hypothetical protein
MGGFDELVTYVYRQRYGSVFKLDLIEFVSEAREDGPVFRLVVNLLFLFAL